MRDPAPEAHLQKHAFSADRPIISYQEELLGRAGFAQSLANAIKQWKGKDSLVIALYGPWGSREHLLLERFSNKWREGIETFRSELRLYAGCRLALRSSPCRRGGTATYENG